LGLAEDNHWADRKDIILRPWEEDADMEEIGARRADLLHLQMSLRARLPRDCLSISPLLRLIMQGNKASEWRRTRSPDMSSSSLNPRRASPLRCPPPPPSMRKPSGMPGRLCSRSSSSITIRFLTMYITRLPPLGRTTRPLFHQCTPSRRGPAAPWVLSRPRISLGLLPSIGRRPSRISEAARRVRDIDNEKPPSGRPLNGTGR
jgi:hypothetical protein